MVLRTLREGVKKVYKGNSQEIKLFLTFFLVFLLFVQWTGANENSRLNMARSVVEDGTFAIDRYHNNSMDKVFYDGHFYSDKAPVASLAGVPVYAVAKAVFPDEVVGEQRRVDRGGGFAGANVVPLNQPLHLTAAQILFVMLLGVIPGALLVVFMKRYLERYYSGKVALFTAVLLGGGTLLFFYSTTALATVLGALFAFLSLYYVDDGGRYRTVFAGLFAGLAAFTVYYIAWVPVFFLVFLLYRRRWNGAGWFVVGAVIGSIPALAYYGAVAGTGFVSFAFKSVFTIPAVRGVAAGAEALAFVPSSFSSFLYDIPYLGVVLAKLLVYPGRGLFFYSPVLLLVFLSFQYRKSVPDREAFYMGVAALLTALAFNVSLDNWFAGASFGPRYLVPAIPFLCLPVAHVLAEGGRKVWYAAAGLGGIGAFQSLVGTVGGVPLSLENQYLRRGIGLDETNLLAPAPYIETILNTLQPFSLDAYLEVAGKFFSYGPHHLLIRPLSGLGVDIRNFMPEGISELALFNVDGHMVSYNVGWAVIPVLTCIVLAVWWIDIEEITGRLMDVDGRYVLVAVAVAVLLVPLRIGGPVFDAGFYREEPGGFRWMRTTGEVTAGVEEGANRIDIGFAGVFNSTQIVTVTHQGKEISRFAVNELFGNNATKSFVLRSAESGSAKIRIETSPGCSWHPPRCLSLAVQEVGVAPLDGK